MPLPGKDNGLDVEGIAVAGPRVYLGLRGPVLRGWATIVEIAVTPGDKPSQLVLGPLETGNCTDCHDVNRATIRMWAKSYGETMNSAQPVTDLNTVKVEGKAGAKPTVEVKTPFAASKTDRRTLTSGNGSIVAAGQRVTINYVGVNGTDGKEFDTSFGKDQAQFTLDGAVHLLPPHFMVVATQNPIESQGVYPLPEAQLDRFLFKLDVDYPSIEEERAIVARYGENRGAPTPGELGIAAAAAPAALDAAARTVAGITLADAVVDYVVRLVRATRDSADLASGASPRAAVLLAGAARARAALDGRDYVVPDDVKALAPAVLRHRLLLSPAAEIEGKQMEALVRDLVEQTEAPR